VLADGIGTAMETTFRRDGAITGGDKGGCHMNDVSDRLTQVLQEVVMNLDRSAPEADPEGDAKAKPGIKEISGGQSRIYDGKRKIRGCAGALRGRPVSVNLHGSSEMTLAALCHAPCRFRIVRNTLGARLNFLQGRRIRSGVQDFDSRFLIRETGRCGLEMFFQRSDIASKMQGLMPFFSLTSEPGSMELSRDFDQQDIRPDQIVGSLEVLSDLAGALEEAMIDSGVMSGEECGNAGREGGVE